MRMGPPRPSSLVHRFTIVMPPVTGRRSEPTFGRAMAIVRTRLSTRSWRTLTSCSSPHRTRGGYVVTTHHGDIWLGTESIIVFEDDAGNELLPLPRTGSTASIDGHTLTYPRAFPTLFADEVLTVNNKGVKHTVALNVRSPLLDAFGHARFLVVRELVHLPDGWSIVPDTQFEPAAWERAAILDC